MSEKLTRKYSEIVGTTFVGGEWQDHDLLSVIGDLESELAQAQADVVALQSVVMKCLAVEGKWLINATQTELDDIDRMIAALPEHLRGASR